MVKLDISLKRVQTFIFEVPRLKAMLGANALVGQTMRHSLPALLDKADQQAQGLPWPSAIRLEQREADPLNQATIDAADHDDPAALYARGILARDGGHFMVLFKDKPAAKHFLVQAEAILAERLPGVLYDAQISPFPAPEDRQPEPKDPHETALLDLPVLQVCEETGQGPASDQEMRDGKTRWQADSVQHRLQAGKQFRAGKTRDIIGLLRPALYPDQTMGWHDPEDLADLAAGGYLALIHADGNGIGKRYKHWREQANAADEAEKEAHGEAFFHGMRVAVRRSVIAALHKTFTEPGGVRPYEVLMLGGDDLLLVCRADRALDFARLYAEELTQYTLADNKPLTVAIGVAIAQKAYPLHRLHELAEGLASSAKRLYRALHEDEQTSVIDWQVVTQSWFADVAEARRQSERVRYQVQGQTETLLLTGRPYRILGETGLERLLKVAAELDAKTTDNRAPVAQPTARSPLRALRSACEQGRVLAEMAFRRLSPEVQGQLGWDDGQLWKSLTLDHDRYALTRALDIIGLREIGRLGRKPERD